MVAIVQSWLEESATSIINDGGNTATLNNHSKEDTATRLARLMDVIGNTTPKVGAMPITVDG